jgi:hypothetical protein
MNLTPDPIKGENVDDFVARCMPLLRENGKTEKEARIISNAIFNRSQRNPDLGASLDNESTWGFPTLEETP